MEDVKFANFDEVLLQYEPMISAIIRKLHIYRDFDSFRSVGYFAIYQAWLRFDETKGNFTPFAYRSIYGAMLDELKRENLHSERSTPVETETAELFAGYAKESSYADLHEVIRGLSLEEQKLIALLFVERYSQAECALTFDISVAGIKKKRQRLLQKMKRQLTEPSN